MRKASSILMAVILFAIPLTSALAQSDTTAVASERKTSRVILEGPDFAKYNCENVGDALKTITGVYVSSTGEVMLRDVSSSKVVVIMDGQKLNTPGSLGVNVSNISIDNVKSIELLRGGRSAEFGADAVGGVIVITSKEKQAQTKTKHQSLALRTTYGSFNRQIYSLNHSLTYNNISTFFSYRRDLWDGNYPYTTPSGSRTDLVNNALNTNYVFFKIGADLGNGQNLNSSYSLYLAHNGSPGMTDNINPDAKLLYDNQTLNLNYQKADLFSGFSLDAGAYYLNFRTRFNDDYSMVPVHSDAKNYATGIDLKQAGALMNLVHLTYGYSFRNDKVDGSEVGIRKRDTHSAFTTVTVGNSGNGLISAWDVALAARYDAPSDFNSELSPRLSVSVTNQSLIKSTFAAHYARSYRAPTFNDLYWPRDAYSIGNPDLRPEYGVNYDVGINLSAPLTDDHSIATAVNYFRNDATDLILWAQTAPGNLWTPSNISKTETWGIETSGTLSLYNNFFTANVEYTYMKALDMGPNPNRHGKYIIYRPKNKMSVTGTFMYHTIEWSTTYTYNGLSYTNPANTQWLPKYITIDTNLSYGFSFVGYRWNAVGELTNLTDTDYQKVLGTPEPGRQYKVSLWLYL